MIENVAAKPDIIDMLELPLNLNFSHIGKLQLKIPWSKLSSAPIEVLLDSVYLVFTPKDKSSWTVIDYNSFERKL